jgi:hypothetical protein
LLADSEGRLVVHPLVPTLVQGDIALIENGLAAGSQVVVSTPRPVIPGMLLSLTTDEALMQSLAGAAQ